jgi:hypothetical protein
MSHHREELRYYADLSRLASIYNTLAAPLGLSKPHTMHRTYRHYNADAEAVRALLEGEGTPDAIGPATRRSTTTRIPQPGEVVRMLLAIADRTIYTPTIRQDLDSSTAENDARRRHANEHKRETTSWETRKKKLGEARILCKTPAETKANKANVSPLLFWS